MADNKEYRPDLWTKSEYARHIKKSATHVNNLVQEGKIPCLKINGGELIIYSVPEVVSETKSLEDVTQE